jgi:hypothetical protein
MGDSSLWREKHKERKPNLPIKDESQSGATDLSPHFFDHADVDEEFDRILKGEEKALYSIVSEENGTATNLEPNVVPVREDEYDLTT